ncbi:hypothetical protein BJV78DRAFT_1252305 [Lactifluus subvellereus]|nr:hypothetical protein BJV78DRAFT_1252305 [Lactifluus subvellereus]
MTEAICRDELLWSYRVITALSPQKWYVPSILIPRQSFSRTWIQHDPYPSNGEKRIPRPSLTILLRASYGGVSFSIPRCFRGPITILPSHWHGRISFSPDLERNTALLSDVNGTRVYFVGKRPLTGKWHSGEENGATEREEEPLDELSVGGIHTSVRINWVGELELPEMKPNGWEDFCFGARRFFTTGRVY